VLVSSLPSRGQASTLQPKRNMHIRKKSSSMR
jgi:hypothetical protein